MTKSEPWRASSRLAFIRAIVDALKPDKRFSVDEWAEKYRVLPPDTPEPGPFRNARTPYLIDIQRTMSPGSGYREGWWMKPHQCGGSVCGENLIGSWICEAAGSILVVFPTLDDGKHWELSRFEPMRLNTAPLKAKVRPAEEKGSGNTKLRKRFPGGVMRLVGSKRVGALKSATIRYIKFEEPDEYDVDVQGQGDPIRLASARTSNFGRRAKIYGDGTPTLDGYSNIQRQVERGDKRKWHLSCPDCGHPQVLVWENLKWEADDPSAAKYPCEKCGTLNAEYAWKSKNYTRRKPGMTEQDAALAGLAHWVATGQGEPGVASWLGLEALALPYGWRPWPTLVQEWLSAQNNEDGLKVFVNNNLARPYKDKELVKISAEELQKRSENYDLMTCPYGGLIVVASVDTQDNRLAVVIRAFGRAEESWGIWAGEIFGDPVFPEVWEKLEQLLTSPIKHESGNVMRVDAAAIDAGGHRAEHVYAFCRNAALRGQHWFAVRGAKSYDAPKISRPKTVEFTWRGQAVPGGVQLRFVGTQSIKNLIDARLRITDSGNGGVYHFPVGFDQDYFKQIRSEKLQWRKDAQGNKARWWVRGEERNEYWDCEVYLYAAYLYLMSGRHADSVFTDRERIYGRHRQLDILDEAQKSQDEEIEKRRAKSTAFSAWMANQASHPPQRGFTKSW